MNSQELSHLEALSKLSLSKEEKTALSSDLDGLLSLLSTLSELPESTPPPKEDTPSVTREDIPAACLAREQALKNAPKQTDGFFVIP